MFDQAQEKQQGQQITMSLAGCGFLGIYHVGMTTCLQRYAPNILIDKIAGASAGAMAAACYLCDVPPHPIVHDILDMARSTRENSLGLLQPNYNVTQIIRSSLERNLPSDAHLRVNGKIHISMTRVRDMKNVIVSEFASREELISAILCSGFIPIFSGCLPPKFRGVRYMDGGCTDNNPILTGNTITVSPFSGQSHISPRPDFQVMNPTSVSLNNTSLEVSTQNVMRIVRALFPAKPQILFKTYEQGFADAYEFLRTNDLLEHSEPSAHICCNNGSRSSADVDESRDNNQVQQQLAGRTLHEIPQAVKAVVEKLTERKTTAVRGLVSLLFWLPVRAYSSAVNVHGYARHFMWLTQ